MRARCGCGQYNYTLGDWLSHFRYGSSFWRAVTHLLFTSIEWR
jgi:hypothetical protein